MVACGSGVGVKNMTGVIEGTRVRVKVGLRPETVGVGVIVGRIVPFNGHP